GDNHEFGSCEQYGQFDGLEDHFGSAGGPRAAASAGVRIERRDDGLASWCCDRGSSGPAAGSRRGGHAARDAGGERGAVVTDEAIVETVWARARRMYERHGASLGYRLDWRSVGLETRLKFYDLSAQAMAVRA